MLLDRGFNPLTCFEVFLGPDFKIWNEIEVDDWRFKASFDKYVEFAKAGVSFSDELVERSLTKLATYPDPEARVYLESIAKDLENLDPEVLMAEVDPFNERELTRILATFHGAHEGSGIEHRRLVRILRETRPLAEE